MFSHRGILTSVALALPAATATSISLAAKAACAAIAADGIETLTSEADWLNSDYINAQSHYWSAANADLIPACAVFPPNVQDVSGIVTALLNQPSVNFAVKSGGYDPNTGYSSVDGGVLISMSKISSTVLSEDQKTAQVGTGSRWLAVAQALDPYNLTVVSGRLGERPSYLFSSDSNSFRRRRCWRLDSGWWPKFPQYSIWSGLRQCCEL
jgi:hypothetical protein